MCICMQSLDIYAFTDFLIKYFKIWFIVIFYKELILKRGFGQSYGKDLLRRTIRKFILYFSEFCTNVRKFWKFNQISGIFKPNKYLFFLPGLKWTWVGWRTGLHSLVGPLPGPSTTGSTLPACGPSRGSTPPWRLVSSARQRHGRRHDAGRWAWCWGHLEGEGSCDIPPLIRDGQS
jgi:hypothetical protein